MFCVWTKQAAKCYSIWKVLFNIPKCYSIVVFQKNDSRWGVFFFGRLFVDDSAVAARPLRSPADPLFARYLLWDLSMIYHLDRVALSQVDSFIFPRIIFEDYFIYKKCWHVYQKKKEHAMRIPITCPTMYRTVVRTHDLIPLFLENSQKRFHHKG